MQKLTQISNYDIWYVDNFYDDPDHVRNNCLSLNYHINKSYNFPGSRTESISFHEKNKNNNLKELYVYFLNALNQINLPFDINECLDISTGFHKIPIIHNNLESVLNIGYIHVDLLEHRFKNKKTFAGLVYLNKSTCSNSGTSFFKMKCTKTQEIKITDNNNFQLFNSFFDGYEYDMLFEEYTNLYNPLVKRKHWNYLLENKNFVDSKFEKVLEVKNVYNRLVLYDSAYFHTASHFYVNNFEERLTQPFFIKML